MKVWFGILGGLAMRLVWSRVLTKKSVCQEKLKEWNRSTFGHVHNTLTKKLKELQLVEESVGTLQSQTMCIN